MIQSCGGSQRALLLTPCPLVLASLKSVLKALNSESIMGTIESKERTSDSRERQAAANTTSPIPVPAAAEQRRNWQRIIHNLCRYAAWPFWQFFQLATHAILSKSRSGGIDSQDKIRHDDSARNSSKLDGSSHGRHANLRQPHRGREESHLHGWSSRTTMGSRLLQIFADICSPPALSTTSTRIDT